MNSAHVMIHQVAGLFRAKEGFSDHPAVEVSFEGARAFCEWAGKRLPTEAEWQLACEGPEKLAYPWGNHFRVSAPEARRLTNIVGGADGFVKTAPVGSFPDGRSPYGLWDMGGNVWEWTSGPEGKPMLRGGSWSNDNSHARCARSDDPSSSHSYFKASSVGFRCAK
jgi:formylglycine-generating enzyme required for sulfatase activity